MTIGTTVDVVLRPRPLEGHLRRALWVILFLSLAVGLMAICVLNLGYAHSRIEQIASAKTGAKVKLGSIWLRPRWPLTVDVVDSEILAADYSLAWKSLRIELAGFSPPYAVTLNFVEPHVLWKPSPAGNSAAVGVTPVAPTSQTSVIPLRITLHVQDGEVESAKGHVRKLQVAFVQPILLNSQATLHVEALIESAALSVALPLTLNSDALTVTPNLMQSQALILGLGGLKAEFSGASEWREGRHRWTMQVSAPDLGQLPSAPLGLPGKDWRGSVQLRGEVSRDGLVKDWLASGDFALSQVAAILQAHSVDWTVEGPAKLEARGKFRYSEGRLSLPLLEGDTDFSEARVNYGSLLSKPAQVPLRLSLRAEEVDGQLQLRRLELNLWNLRANVQGAVKLQAPYLGQLSFQLPPLDLAGCEKIFPPLAQMPVKGFLTLQGGLDGPLQQPLDGRLALTAFKFKDIAATVNYDKQSVFKMRGPVNLSLEGSLAYAAHKINQLQANGKAQLKDVALVAGPLRKEPGQELNLNLRARQVSGGGGVEVQMLQVQSFFGQLTASGQVTGFSPLAGHLRLALSPLDLGELRIALPAQHEQIPKGVLRGQIEWVGVLDPKLAWTEWPIQMAGSLKVQLPEFKVAPKSATEKQNKNELGKSSLSDSGLLPKSYLLDHLRLDLVGDVEVLEAAGLKVSGLHAEGRIQDGHYVGGGSVREFFSGHLTFKEVDIPLVKIHPDLRANLEWHDVIIQEAMNFVKPEMKEFATGKMVGRVELSSALPGAMDFYARLKAKGELYLEPVVLNSIKLGQIINDFVKQAPFIKMRPLKVEAMNGVVQCRFDLRGQSMQIERLLAKDLTGNELQLQGKVLLPQVQGDMVGNFLWANPQVQGCLLEGNSDAQGRMVIPVAVKGELMHPGFSSLSDLVAKLGSKTLQCEQKKLVDRLKSGDGKKLEEELKKQLKGLFGN